MSRPKPPPGSEPQIGLRLGLLIRDSSNPGMTQIPQKLPAGHLAGSCPRHPSCGGRPAELLSTCSSSTAKGMSPHFARICRDMLPHSCRFAPNLDRHRPMLGELAPNAPQIGQCWSKFLTYPCRRSRKCPEIPLAAIFAHLFSKPAACVRRPVRRGQFGRHIFGHFVRPSAVRGARICSVCD